MALTRTQRAKLAKQGFSKKDIADMESTLGADDDDDDTPGRRGSGARVMIVEGKEADSLLERLFGSDGDEADDEADDDDEGAEDDEPAPEPDAKPRSGPRYFGRESA